MTRRRWILLGAIGLLVLVAGLAGPRLRGDPRPRVSAALLARAGVSQPLDPVGVRLTWTGVAGVRFEIGQGEAPPKVVLVDPFVTRQSIVDFLSPIDSDEATAHAAFPAANVILISHGHSDHFGDVPAIAARTGAPVVASRSTCILFHNFGGTGPCEAVPGDSPIARSIGLEAFPHPHGNNPAVGWLVTGDVVPGPVGPQYVWDLKDGGPLAFVLRVNGRVIYHQGSAGLDEGLLAAIRGLKPDLALIGVALRQRTPDFEARLFEALQPRRVAAIHFDDFFGRTLADEVPPLPGADLPAFEREVTTRLGEGALVRLKPFVPWDLPPAGLP